LVLREAESRLGRHLRRLGVAGIAARDLADDPLAAAFAVEAHAEPRIRALLFTRARALRHALLDEPPCRRDLRQREHSGHGDRQPYRLRQVLDRDVVAVAELGPVAFE